MLCGSDKCLSDCANCLSYDLIHSSRHLFLVIMSMSDIAANDAMILGKVDTLRACDTI